MPVKASSAPHVHAVSAFFSTIALSSGSCSSSARMFPTRRHSLSTVFLGQGAIALQQRCEQLVFFTVAHLVSRLTGCRARQSSSLHFPPPQLHRHRQLAQARRCGSSSWLQAHADAFLSLLSVSVMWTSAKPDRAAFSASPG